MRPTHLHSGKGVPYFLTGDKGSLLVEPCLLLIHAHTKLVVVQRLHQLLTSAGGEVGEGQYGCVRQH